MPCTIFPLDRPILQSITKLEDEYGDFYEKLTLENNTDRILAMRGDIQEDQIRTLEVDAMPDTGAWTLIINDNIRRQLDLETVGTVTSSLADGSTAQYDLTEAVGIRWKDRQTIQQAVVVPNGKEVLLGALPLEALDLCVDMVNQQLVGVHGDSPVHVLY